MSLVSRPMVKLRCLISPRASALGRKPTLWATCFTRSRVSSLMRPVSLRAFDAVEMLTPAPAATS